MKLLVDTSSLIWRALFAGKDIENGITVEHEGKTLFVNSAQYGLDNAISALNFTLRSLNASPSEVIFALEGEKSLERRKGFLSTYKGSRSSSRAPEQYEAFNTCREELLTTFLNVGACTAQNKSAEADDVLAFLAQNLEGEIVILTEDGDLAALINERISLWRKGERLLENPYGPFPPKFITLYKALVGDTSDCIPGAKGFGEKAFLTMYAQIGDQGLGALVGMIQRGTLHDLEEDVADFKPFRKVIEHSEIVKASYAVAQLRPEWCDTLLYPLQWRVGMVRGRDVVKDPRLFGWAQQVRLVDATNYEGAYAYLKSRLAETKEFVLDLETTVSEESEDWLAQRNKGGGIDVIGSTIVGCGITFGANLQYGFYISVNHADTKNISLEQFRKMLELFPKDRLTIAHNAAGFELPVLFNAFGAVWKENDWRGLFPNMVDSRIAASYWNENAPSHGLKQLSKSLLGYEQTSYETVTTKTREDGTTYQVKMDGLTAKETLAYGLDDVFCTGAIWNFFKSVMQIEKSWTAFKEVEQKPMYLSALSYAQGTPVSLERLFKLKKDDEEKYATLEETLNAYLIEKGWDGTQTPVFTELTPANVKAATQIILGVALETQVRKIDKLAILIDLLEHKDAPLLAEFVKEQNLSQINEWVARRFSGKPNLNVGSNKQLTQLMYETMALKPRLRNKVTDVMRTKGIREGNKRADDEAMAMAIKMGDAQGETAKALTALTEMKSINTRSGLYWNPYPSMVHWKTRRLHPELRQCSTNTRRHSGAAPNIQQLSADKGGVRSVIIPHHKNAVIVSCDLAGQEIRLLADLSRDTNMMSAYSGDELKDLHSFTAAMILGISYEAFRAQYKSEDKAISDKANEARQNAKVVFFASSYGAAAPKIAEGLGIKEDVAQGFIDALDRAFPRINLWKAETEQFAKANGWVPISGGAPRHLRELVTSEDKWLASKALRQASNARIQGAGGNQLRTIMGGIWDSTLMEEYDFKFYWPVHDEIVISVSKADAVPVIQKLHALMCGQFLDVLPSSSSIGIGDSFGNLNEIGEVPDSALIESALLSL